MKEQKGTREQSGGFMIARTYAGLVAMLSDEEAGRVLKGLIHEFWNYGEGAAVSDDPLKNALYNSVLQSAREIDDSYWAEREQKREAGRKGAEARRQKNVAAPAALSGAEECCSSAKLNKNKENKINKNKLNESKVKQTGAAEAADLLTPPSAALTEAQKKILVDKYGHSTVEQYERRFADWSAAKPVCNANAFKSISRWIEEDKPERLSQTCSSFCAEAVEKAVSERYRRLLGG